MKKNPAQEIVESMQILIDNAMKKTTNINSGIITAINDNKTYTVLVKGKINILPSYPKNSRISIGDRVMVIVPQGQNNQAFIMPHSFTDVQGSLDIVDESIDTTTSTSISSDIYGNGIFIRDVNNEQIGYIRAVSLSTDYTGIEISAIRNINGTSYNNSVSLLIDDSGNNLIKISDPNAWRTALNII